MPVQEITPGVFIETAYRMANVGCIVTDEGVVLVDAPIAPTETRNWREFVLSKGEPRYFLCTHEHPDHIGGRGFFSEAETICHESIKDKFTGCQELLMNFLPGIGLEGDRDFTGYTPREPSFTFSDRMTLLFGGRRIEFLSGDGHTPCQGMVWLPEDSLLFAGDNVVNQWPPFCHDAVIDGWSDTLNRIHSQIQPHRIVPGHGPLCDGGYALNVRDILDEAKRRVRDLIAQGKGREEISEMAPFGDRFDIPEWFGPADRLRRATMENLYGFCKSE